jgi:hypothetical protein
MTSNSFFVNWDTEVGKDVSHMISILPVDEMWGEIFSGYQ